MTFEGFFCDRGYLCVMTFAPDGVWFVVLFVFGCFLFVVLLFRSVDVHVNFSFSFFSSFSFVFLYLFFLFYLLVLNYMLNYWFAHA